MSLLEKSDEEIFKIADPIWSNLVKSSNIKDYGGFTRDFSSQMLYGANEVELGKQWASNELISSLAEGCKPFGCLRRGQGQQEWSTQTHQALRPQSVVRWTRLNEPKEHQPIHLWHPC